MRASLSHRGFTDPVLNAQAVFRTVMMALARPGTIGDLAAGALAPPAPLTAELAAIALTLCDHETPVWFDRRLSAAPDVLTFIKFQTGAPIADDPAKAGFAFAVDMSGLPPLSAFAQGGDDEVAEIATAQIDNQLSLAVDRVMAEGSLYDRDLAALAIKQARGDLIEAIFLVRAFRTTLPRLGVSDPIETNAMAIRRRVSATFKDLPGGQLLGPTFDYTHRLI